MTGISSSGQASLPTANSTKSYWHRDPSKILFGHRTTPSLPTKADLVIIGSGISGASAAHFLRGNDKGKDLHIVMLEAREACWGATGRASQFYPNSSTHTNNLTERRPLSTPIIQRPSRSWSLRTPQLPDSQSARRETQYPM
jgi:choline dehydrogenase-like flavoprotein